MCYVVSADTRCSFVFVLRCIYSLRANRSLTRRHMGLDVAASILVVLVLCCNRSVQPIVLRRYNGGYALPVPCLVLSICFALSSAET